MVHVAFCSSSMSPDNIPCCASVAAGRAWSTREHARGWGAWKWGHPWGRSVVHLIVVNPIQKLLVWSFLYMYEICYFMIFMLCPFEDGNGFKTSSSCPWFHGVPITLQGLEPNYRWPSPQLAGKSLKEQGIHCHEGEKLMVPWCHWPQKMCVLSKSEMCEYVAAQDRGGDGWWLASWIIWWVFGVGFGQYGKYKIII